VTQLTVLGTMHEVGYHHGVITAETPTRPRSQYGVAKNALRQSLEISLTGSGSVLQWLRCFYIYGDDAVNRSVFTKISEAARAGLPTFPFTSGTNQYDFIEVRDLADQIAAVVQRPDVAGIINCCSGEPESLGSRVEAYIRDHGLDIRLEYGAFPDRDYDSPAVWGDASTIRAVMAAHRARLSQTEGLVPESTSTLVLPRPPLDALSAAPELEAPVATCDVDSLA
jgi:nucleoside-diphosphate-sugar epimerase